MAAPLTKQEIHRRVETLELLVGTIKRAASPEQQAETYELIRQHFARLLGDLYEDMARGQEPASPGPGED
jgi:hypothetical protein